MEKSDDLLAGAQRSYDKALVKLKEAEDRLDEAKLAAVDPVVIHTMTGE